MSETVEVRTVVNGQPVQAMVPARLTLADFLRVELRLTGTHLGCEHGVCGACSVLLDGISVRACLLFAVQVDGAEVVTVEGLQANGTTAHLRGAFTRCHGLQCGFCTPGMLVAATELIDDPRTPRPLTEQVVREALSGNMCRCTGYQGIVQAVMEVAEAGASCTTCEERVSGLNEYGTDEMDALVDGQALIGQQELR